MTDEGQWIQWDDLGEWCPECLKEFPGKKLCSTHKQPLVRRTPESDFGLSAKYSRLQCIVPFNGRSYVFRGMSKQDRKPLVIKIAAGDPARFHRLKQESDILNALDHPNIVKLVQSGQFDKTPFYITEFVAGQSLASLIEEKTRIPIVRFLRLFISIADALQHAHDRSMVHWDLKPADILVDGAWRPTLIDFGKGKAWLHSGNRSRQLTIAGDIFGDPQYVAPETAGGDANWEVTPSANIYSLSCIMYECLEGKPPFDAKTWPRMIQLKRQDKIRPFSESVNNTLPPKLKDLVMRGLNVDPQLRPGSMQEIISELTSLLQALTGE